MAADGVRRIARALYDRARLKEKMEATKMFENLDTNGDGKISLREFINGVASDLSNARVFQALDSDNDEALDFDDALVLFYYTNNAIKILRCDGCRDFLLGPSFSCFECLCDGGYALCCDCYGGGKFPHKHPLFHDQALLVKLSITKDRAKEEMKNLSEIAKSYYKAASPEVKSLAEDFFGSMDADGDGGVEIEEFLSFVREQGYAHMNNNTFFKELDIDGNGRLGFWEVMTLYYIIKSGRPFCGRCGDFIPGIYFSCVVCIEDRRKSFDICHGCYESGKCKHNHDGVRALFLDNYTLLQAKQDSESSTIYFKNERRIKVVKQTNARPPTSTAMVVAPDHHRPSNNHNSLQLLPKLWRRQRSKYWTRRFQWPASPPPRVTYCEALLPEID